ncbi:ribosomal protein L15 protein [Besnoitia besnoiti]|uniref:Ribosomal protein L15 protein n=1 Tax=Besnoitia besnoiti TaxID=94643 RepID=A0A2A9MHD6_BESBE|nr:ribosomal protein L15 protein [Besnoitia besnoiti]PFH36584.1 ribosomal protein L15 protein [Besnoitia besnoiti]
MKRKKKNVRGVLRHATSFSAALPFLLFALIYSRCCSALRRQASLVSLPSHIASWSHDSHLLSAASPAFAHSAASRSPTLPRAAVSSSRASLGFLPSSLSSHVSRLSLPHSPLTPSSGERSLFFDSDSPLHTLCASGSSGLSPSAEVCRGHNKDSSSAYRASLLFSSGERESGSARETRKRKTRLWSFSETSFSLFPRLPLSCGVCTPQPLAHVPSAFPPQLSPARCQAVGLVSLVSALSGASPLSVSSTFLFPVRASASSSSLRSSSASSSPPCDPPLAASLSSPSSDSASVNSPSSCPSSPSCSPSPPSPPSHSSSHPSSPSPSSSSSSSFDYYFHPLTSAKHYLSAQFPSSSLFSRLVSLLPPPPSPASPRYREEKVARKKLRKKHFQLRAFIQDKLRARQENAFLFHHEHDPSLMDETDAKKKNKIIHPIFRSVEATHQKKRMRERRKGLLRREAELERALQRRKDDSHAESDENWHEGRSASETSAAADEEENCLEDNETRKATPREQTSHGDRREAAPAAHIQVPAPDTEEIHAGTGAAEGEEESESAVAATTARREELERELDAVRLQRREVERDLEDLLRLEEAATTYLNAKRPEKKKAGSLGLKARRRLAQAEAEGRREEEGGAFAIREIVEASARKELEKEEQIRGARGGGASAAVEKPPAINRFREKWETDPVSAYRRKMLERRGQITMPLSESVPEAGEGTEDFEPLADAEAEAYYAQAADLGAEARRLNARMLHLSQKILARIYVIEHDYSISFDERMARMAPLRRELQRIQRPYHKMFICLLRERDRRTGGPSLDYTVDNPLLPPPEEDSQSSLSPSLEAPFVPPPVPRNAAWKRNISRDMSIVPFYMRLETGEAPREGSTAEEAKEEAKEEKEGEKKREHEGEKEGEDGEAHSASGAGDSAPVPYPESDAHLPRAPPRAPPVYQELVWNLSAPKCWSSAFYVRSPGARVAGDSGDTRGDTGRDAAGAEPEGEAWMTPEEEERQRREERKVFSRWWTRKQRMLAENQPNFEWTFTALGEGRRTGEYFFGLDNMLKCRRKRKKRLGRGDASGKGGSAGRGTKGQKARSGGSIPLSFEGGQMPLYRKLPKFVGRPLGPAHQEKYRKYPFQLIRLPQLNVMRNGDTCDWLTLSESGAALGRFRRDCPVKVVGPSLKASTQAKEGTKLSVRNLTVKAHAFTKRAARAIIALGGRCLLLQRRTQDRVVAEYNPDYVPAKKSTVVAPEEEETPGSAQAGTEIEDSERPLQQLARLRRRVLSLQLQGLTKLFRAHRERLQRSPRPRKRRARRVHNLAARIERLQAELADLRQEHRGTEEEEEEDLVVLSKIPRRFVYPGRLPPKQRDLLRWRRFLLKKQREALELEDSRHAAS